MNKQKIGDFIKKKRKEKGLTQVELAEKIGITDRAISKWERGICCPDISLLKDLCKILDININELLSGNELKEITKEQSEDILVETVKTYTNVEKKKNKALLIFTIVILIFYTFIVFAMYLTFNQKNKRDGMNWETIQTKKVAERIFNALENYDYKAIKNIENKYTDIIKNGGNAELIDNEAKCVEYLEKDKDTSWAFACRLKDFESNGIKFKSHEFTDQYYNYLGSYGVQYKVTISYKNIDSDIFVSLSTHNGVINNLYSTGVFVNKDGIIELKEAGYDTIFDKINYFFNIIYDDRYMETVNIDEINTYISTKTLKPNLFNRNEIIKVAIDNYSQYKNNFEYTDKNTIDKVYNLFKDLETNVASKSNEPENAEELYKVTFFNDENMLIQSDNDIFKAIVHVYMKGNKYYAEEQKNGIYEITEDAFNVIKNLAK